MQSELVTSYYTTMERANCLIYQLAAQDPVSDISFGPDPHRVYDIHGSLGNVWEPSALVNISEMTEKSSDNASDAQNIVSRSPGLELSLETSIVSQPWLCIRMVVIMA